MTTLRLHTNTTSTLLMSRRLCSAKESSYTYAYRNNSTPLLRYQSFSLFQLLCSHVLSSSLHINIYQPSTSANNCIYVYLLVHVIAIAPHLLFIFHAKWAKKFDISNIYNLLIFIFSQ